MQEVYDKLARYGATLRECLSVLSGSSPEEPLVGRAFEDLGEHFAALGDVGELRRTAPADQLERLDAELDELTRLLAVLTSTVGRDRDRLLLLLDRARTARQSCATLRPDGRTGASCDVRG